ncbi:MAG: nicotianamine synthase family protein [Alphaproteobacteria bacterium]|nr:nicotianamine synthase family protein [Alphaproteobacteria bacterium]
MERRIPVQSRTWDIDDSIDQVVRICVEAVQIASVSDLRLEQLFGELDKILLDLDDAQIGAVRQDPRYSSIRERFHLIRAEYEYRREMAVAQTIADAGREAAADQFRSADWYEIAQAFEVRSLAPYRCRRMIWLGAGPFPTSAIYFARANPGLSIVCVDCDAEACRLAKEVVRIFDCPTLEVVHADALDLSDFSYYDGVMVGLVVGVTDADKMRVVEHYTRHVPPETLLVFRTAVSSGTIIWPSVDLCLLDGVPHRLLPDPPQKLYSLIVVDRSGSGS